MRQVVLEYESPIGLESSITRAIQREILMLTLAIRLSRQALTQFEQRYQMPSAEFFAKMERGELDDTADFIEWSGEYELLQRAEQKLHGLQGLKICS
jgi:hypothetical protein